MVIKDHPLGFMQVKIQENKTRQSPRGKRVQALDETFGMTGIGKVGI